MEHDAEIKIVARVLEGDRQAYALLVEEYKTPIYNLAYRMTRNLEDADDLTQDIFIRAYVHLWRYNPQKKFFTWLYTIALNQIRNHLKKIKKRNKLDMNNVLAVQKQDSSHDFIDGSDIEIKLATLDEYTRFLIIMKYQQELSFQDIADITGKSISALKMRIYRGLEELKKKMRK